MDIKTLEKAANEFRKLSVKKKKLEEEMEPFRKILIDAAKNTGCVLNLSSAVVEKRIKKKVLFNREEITPQWIQNMRKEKLFDMVKIDIDRKAVDKSTSEKLVEYLSEIGYSIDEVPEYSIRIKPINDDSWFHKLFKQSE